MFVITDVADGGFDVTESNIEHNHDGWVRIAAFQIGNPGLDGWITIASVTLAGDLDDLGSLRMTVNTLSDATPQCSPIDSTVDGFMITASPPSTSTDFRRGGDGTYPLIPAPSPAISSAAGTPVEEETAAETPTPEQVMEFHAEPPSLPPPILSPIAGIVIVAVAATLGIVMATRAAEDHKKATIATIAIVIVTVAAIIGMMLM